MIPEYKLYHGAALAELIDIMTCAVSITELSEVGRLSSYVLNGTVGVNIKHASQRLSPWPFTFTSNNIDEIGHLRRSLRAFALILVCNTDGFVCLSDAELASLVGSQPEEGCWLRVSRRRGKWYDVTGSTGLKVKKPGGLDAISALFAVDRRSIENHELLNVASSAER